MQFRSGVQSTATLNGVELATTNWSVSPEVDMVQFANSKTQEYRYKDPVYKNCDFSITIDWDLDENVFAVAPNVTIGTRLTNVKLYLRGTSGIFWSFPLAIVVSTPQQSETEGKITTTLNLTNDGPFTPPGL